MKKKNVLGVIVLILALSTSIVVNADPSTSDPFANANTNPNAPDSIWKSNGYIEFRKDNETAVFDARDFQTVSDKISALATKVDEIDNDLDEINSNLCGISFAQDANGNWGYRKPGADSVIPFKKGGSYSLTVSVSASGTSQNSSGDAIYNMSCTGNAVYKLNDGKIAETSHTYGSGTSRRGNMSIASISVSITELK